jgi:hypothetical protein
MRRDRARPTFRVALGLLAVTLVPALAGCGRPPSANPSARGTVAGPADEGLEAARGLLRKETDLKACQAAIQQLNTHLARHPDPQLQELVAAERAKGQQQGNLLGLDEDELPELYAATFTPLDAHHLDLCFLLRDAARSLNPDELTPRDKAAAAFAWVVRQVQLRETPGAALPPQFVLRRGWGTSLERSLVFLALLRQLGLDGGMVFRPAPDGGKSLYAWIPGALVDGDIFLFDTRMGLALPGPKGDGIATLRQVRADRDLLGALTVDPAYPYDVTPTQAARAEVHVVFFPSELSPRMRYLEGLLAANNPVRLTGDPVAVKEKFREATRGQGVEIRLWNRPGDPDTPARVQRRFLPPEEGGGDRTDQKVQALRQLIPWEKLPPLIPKLRGEQGQRLAQVFGQMFLEFYTNPRKPHELLLRGRFDEATGAFMQAREGLKKAALAYDPDLEKRVTQWSEALFRAQERFRELRQQTPAGQAETDPGVEEAKAEVDRIWQEGQEAMAQLLLGAAGEQIGGETTYYLALAKQEQAERHPARSRQSGRNPSPAAAKEAQTAWQEAADWWDTFAREYPGAQSAAAARTLQAQTLEALGQRPRAIALLAELSNLSKLERTAHLYRVRQLKKQ